MKKYLLLIVVLTGIFTRLAETKNWFHYTLRDTYTIDYPKRPNTTRPQKNLVYTVYKTNDKGVNYQYTSSVNEISESSMPTTAAAGKKLLHKLMNNSVKKNDATLVSSKDITVGSYNGVDFEMALNKKPANLSFRFYIIKKDLVILTVGTPRVIKGNADIARFFDSFVWIK